MEIGRPRRAENENARRELYARFFLSWDARVTRINWPRGEISFETKKRRAPIIETTELFLTELYGPRGFTLIEIRKPGDFILPVRVK